jgi:hypothetical protein
LAFCGFNEGAICGCPLEVAPGERYTNETEMKQK